MYYKKTTWNTNMPLSLLEDLKIILLEEPNQQDLQEICLYSTQSFCNKYL